MTTIQEVHAAVLTLYRTRDTRERDQVNSFLIQFTDTEEAWAVSVQLLVGVDPSLVEVQYFAANTIYAKICRDGGKLRADPGLAASLSQPLMGFLRQSVVEGRTLDKTVMNRVCIAAAALAIKMKDGLVGFMQEAFQFFGGNLETIVTMPANSLSIGLSILKAVPEEVEKVDMSKGYREDLQAKLREMVPHVVQVIQQLLLNIRGNMVEPALYALTSYLQLGALTLTSMASDFPRLFESFLAILVSPQSVLSNTLISACRTLSRLAGVNEYPRPSKRDDVIRRLFSALLSGLPAVSEILEEEEDTAAHSYCTMLVDLAKSEIDLLSRGEEESLRIIEVLLTLTNYPNRNVVAMVMEFWLELQEVPLEKRHPFLCQPLLVKLVEVILTHISYPNEFVSWDDNELDMDFDDFNDFREGDLVRELLEECYRMLRSQYFLQLRQKLDGTSPPWQARQHDRLETTDIICTLKDSCGWDLIAYWDAVWVLAVQVPEVALLMMQQVNRVAMEYLKHGNIATNANTGVGMEDQVMTARLLLELMHQYISTPALYTEPLVHRSLARLLGSYHPLFTQPQPSNSRVAGLVTPEQGATMLHLALICLHDAVKDQDAAPPACQALRSLCVAPTSSRQITTRPECLDIVLQTLATATHAKVVEVADRLLLIEGVVRILVSLPVDQGRALLNHFARPVLDTMDANLPSSTHKGNVLIVSEELQLLTKIISFSDVPVGPDGSHVAQDLIQAVWPVLERVAATHRTNTSVMDNLFPVYSSMILCVRPLIAPHFPSLINIIMGLYQETTHEGALKCVSSALEVFRDTSTETQQSFAALLSLIAKHTFTYMQAGHPPSECPQLVKALFEMAHRYLVFCPNALFGPPEFSTLFELAVYCLQEIERESTRAVIVFLQTILTHALSSGEPYVPRIYQCLENRGEEIVKSIFFALAGRAPSILWPNFCEFLYAMLQACGAAPHTHCYHWLRVAVHTAFMANDPATQRFTAQEEEMLLAMITRLASESKPKFKSLMMDCAKICNSELTADSLLAYQIE